MNKLKTVEDIAKKELQALRENVEKSKGKAIVLVHPFYYQKEKEIKVSEELIKKSKFPVIILEESEEIPLLKQRLQKLKIHSPLILPTVSNTPNLKAKGVKAIVNWFFPARKLISILSTAGVKRVFVGGMETRKKPNLSVFMHEKKQLPANRKPSANTVSDGCAGLVYEKLIKSKKFDAIRLIPNTVFPDKPKYKLKTPKVKPKKPKLKPKLR